MIKGKTNFSLWIAVVIVLATTLAKSTVRADIAAEFPVSSFTGGKSGFVGNSPFRPAQVFKVTGSGTLKNISVALSKNGPLLATNIIIEFRETIAGIPSSVVLATASVNGRLLEGTTPVLPRMLSGDFSTFNINLTAGSTYAFSLRIDGTGSAFACGSGAYIVYPYPDGLLFDSIDSGITWLAHPLDDLNFQVTTVPDSDGDGVNDNNDICPNTPAGDMVDAHGCSIEQLVPCEGPKNGGDWKNHGQYISSLTKVAQAFFVAGVITGPEKDVILEAAAQSACGKK